MNTERDSNPPTIASSRYGFCSTLILSVALLLLRFVFPPERFEKIRNDLLSNENEDEEPSDVEIGHPLTYPGKLYLLDVPS